MVAWRFLGRNGKPGWAEEVQFPAMAGPRLRQSDQKTKPEAGYWLFK